MSKNYVQGQSGPFEVIIGLEIHAQVVSNAKLFSGASTAFGSDPNTNVAFVDAGMPGMLPVINSVCVDQAIKTGLGFHGTVNRLSIFDRKNYFYPDLPTGYQISQFYHPIISGGYMDIDLEDGETKRIGITRLHLEQDAGKSIHDLHPSKSYIDLNRAGIALMEIVSEPDMRSAEEAMAYVKKLRTLVRYLGTCDGNMEQGNLRVDANISLRRPGAPFGTRVEVKNVNSIRFLGQAIQYEIERQLEIIEAGGSIVQETRLFDPNKGETRSMRSKEDAHDYRYFPDPDLPPLRLTQERINTIKSQLPELPDDKRKRFIDDLGLSTYDASVLVDEKEIADYYENVLKACNNPQKVAKLVANWMLGEVFAMMNKEGHTIDSISLSPTHLAELVELIDSDVISGKIAKDVFAKMWESKESPKAIVESLGLKQITDPKEIENAIDAILAKEADKVAQYQSGKVQLFGFFVGQIMKATQGKANPALVNEILKRKIGDGNV